MSHEILINATLITENLSAKIYEFVIDDSISIVECVYMESLAEGVIKPVHDYLNTLQGDLFELNHVRVNPRVDNTRIIQVLTDALETIGVSVSNPPDDKSMKMCFKPLGEISDNVRFYFHLDGKLIFLSPALRPKIVSSLSQNNIVQLPKNTL